jgi:Kef-type K+ transport system membrane component KefB
MAFGIFITVFFASVGLSMNLPLQELFTPVILIIIGVAISAKVIGGFLGSYPYLRNRNAALLVGLGMVPRGDLTLALAQSALLTGIISQQVYTATILLVLVTVLLTPVFLKIGLNRMTDRMEKENIPVSGSPSGKDGQ